jgi:inhibitor of KinA
MPPRQSDIQFKPASDHSLLIYFGDRISVEINDRLRKLLQLLESDPIAGIRNLHPAYSSLLVKFDASRLTHADLQTRLARHLDRLDEVPLPSPRQVEIPVCYGGTHGPDLDEVAVSHGISAAKVIELHSSATYLVYFLGFVPGFAYLGELPPELASPRLATPRPRVPKGSVGIAGTQTGVYPFATPGGWRLIGRTPLAMFQPEESGLSRLIIGDKVHFRPISADEFTALERQCA